LTYRHIPKSPRVVNPVENFWDFCAQCNFYSNDVEATRGLLRDQFGKVCPNATPKEISEAHTRIDAIVKGQA
jgi:hypothetical protein